VGNQINVMAWNYRNYGKSEGTANPYVSYHDSEAVLKFLLEDLGIEGKIGCFGRSLGGTCATHLAANYPEHISFLFVDRSLGTLKSMS
jgi:homoserine acetyltransferase